MNTFLCTQNKALTACLALGFMLAGSPAIAQSDLSLQRLKVDPSARFQVRDDETPFFWLGDTAWFIMRLSNDEISHYLSNRAQKGFTGIQVDLNPHAWTNMMAP